GTDGGDAGATDGDDGGGAADGPSIESETGSGGGDGIDGTVEYVADPLADYAVSALEPGVVFFAGAALVFTVAWAYWYWSANR
ncbi:ArsR family transcriptional regulator, partial [Halorubrum pallidum]